MSLLLRGLTIIRSLGPGKIASHHSCATSSKRNIAGSRKSMRLVDRWSKSNCLPSHRSFSTTTSSLNDAPRKAKSRQEETALLVEAMKKMKASLPTQGKTLDAERLKMLESQTAEDLVAKMPESARTRTLELLEQAQSTGDVKDLLEQMDAFSIMSSADFTQERLEKEASSNKELLDFLASPMPHRGASPETNEAELFRRNLDMRVSHISTLTLAAEANEETRKEFAEANLTLAVLDMIPLSLDKPAVMCVLIRALRSMASQEKAVEQLLEDQNFIGTLVSLLKSADVSLRIEASALIALLTVVRDAVLALKDQNAVPLLTSILSSPMAQDEQAIYNNGIVALVRIVGESGDSIVEDLKKAQAVTPLCNIINKLDRTPAVHDAVITLLAILAGSAEVSLQIVSAGCIPSLARILHAYVQIVTGDAPQREFRRITKLEHATTTAQTTEELEGIVDDNEDAMEDQINPIFRGSDLEDVVCLVRLLSRVPAARHQMVEAGVLDSLAALIALPTLTFSQKTHATSCMYFFAADSSCREATAACGAAKTLIDQLYQAGTSAEEIAFQAHALTVVASLSTFEEVQKHLTHKHWLSAVVSRAPKAPSKHLQMFIGTLLLNLLKSDRGDEVVEMVNTSPSLTATVAHMVREEQLNPPTQPIWTKIFSMT